MAQKWPFKATTDTLIQVGSAADYVQKQVLNRWQHLLAFL